MGSLSSFILSCRRVLVDHMICAIRSLKKLKLTGNAKCITTF